MRLRHRWFPLFMSLLLPGCYTYAPARIDTVPVGASVRAHLTEPAHSALRDTVGPSERALIGELLERDAGTILLQVPWALTPDAPPMQTVHQRLRFRETELAGLELRRLDPLRTGVIVGALGAVTLYALTQIFGGTAGAQGAEPEPPSPQQHRR